MGFKSKRAYMRLVWEKFGQMHHERDIIFIYHQSRDCIRTSRFGDFQPSVRDSVILGDWLLKQLVYANMFELD